MTKEISSRGDKAEVETGLIFQPKFDADGLIPAIATASDTGEVLMFAWMNREALLATLDTRRAHFWSRSRGKLWRKGEDSGNELIVNDIRVDCDQDVIAMSVTLVGDKVACHTGARSCFYRRIDLDSEQTAGPITLQHI
ncbi:MAG: phosphoribosyl-AMP cyclohydrolase [Pseudomonadota bacterium]